MIIEQEECGVCEKCVPVCPKGLIKRIGFKMIISDGCNKCGDCLNACPLGAIFLDEE